MRPTARTGLVAVAFTAACASESAEPSLGYAAEVVEVRVLGDGFVRTGDRRLPLEALVLELRQRARAMDATARLQFRVDVAVDPDGGEVAAHGADLLLEQLQILGVRQARVGFR